MEKVCFKCGKSKPLGCFYKHSKMADGHLNKCKDCTKSDVKAHRASNVDRIREYDRTRNKANEERKQAKREYLSKYSKANKEKRYAQSKLRYAVISGKIKRLPYFVCGDQKSEAHHPDYSAPLDVVWLCSPHHHQIHAEFSRT